MSVGRLIGMYETVWMIQSHRQQRLAWADAQEARHARARAEAAAAAQLRAMLLANPGGALGNAKLNDPESLKAAGLL